MYRAHGYHLVKGVYSPLMAGSSVQVQPRYQRTRGQAD